MSSILGRLRPSQAFIGGLIAVLLATAGEAVWDVIAKPGLGATGRLLLSTITLGSQRVRDVAYSSAALDPTPLASLIVLQIISIVPYALAMFFLGFDVGEGRGKRRLAQFKQELQEAMSAATSSEAGIQTVNELRDRELEKMRKANLTLRRWGIGLGLLVGLVAWVALQVLSQAVAIRRVFLADLAIVAPYIPPSEEVRLRARFASVRTRAEYSPIAESLKTAARANGVTLVDAELW